MTDGPIGYTQAVAMGLDGKGTEDGTKPTHPYVVGIAAAVAAIGLFLAARWALGEVYVADWESDPGSQQPVMLEAVNFPVPEVVSYNSGVYEFEHGDYKAASNDFKNAYRAMGGHDGSGRECDARVNYALSLVTPVNVDAIAADPDLQSREQRTNDAIVVLTQARNALTEEGCASDDGDPHDADAEQLKEDIDRALDKLERQQRQDRQEEQQQQQQRQQQQGQQGQQGQQSDPNGEQDGGSDGGNREGGDADGDSDGGGNREGGNAEGNSEDGDADGSSEGGSTDGSSDGGNADSGNQDDGTGGDGGSGNEDGGRAGGQSGNKEGEGGSGNEDGEGSGGVDKEDGSGKIDEDDLEQRLHDRRSGNGEGGGSTSPDLEDWLGGRSDRPW